MKKIKLNFVDMWVDFDAHDNFFTRILSKRFEVEISPNPDFVICSVFGSDFKKYTCPRIIFIGENIVPNFNAYDYALSFEFLEYGDRHLRLPLYYMYLDNYIHEGRKFDRKITPEDAKRKFCNFVYSNNLQADPIRQEFFHQLSKYKQVDSGGRFLNNIGGAIKDKLEFQKKYKFSIAFENSTHPGYTTEKILDAFLSKTIPIYWGSSLVGRDFNKDAFIDVNDYDSIDEVIKVIMELDNDDEKYLQKLSLPYLNNEKFCENLNDDKILDFFENIFSNPHIYHKDSLPNRDENGHYGKVPFSIRMLSAMIPIKSMRHRFRNYLIDRDKIKKYQKFIKKD
ncbi:glycosyltransferase family 10 domain-containing protein [Helicobacter cappadocius]|uniref:Glycosyltransferase family 10 n=1 Tax=Helicobacter cappadocius TaxID=3063998 RepID=A0AA90ST01_9HELI|nr:MULTISPECIES: glycosyltransferase family 10 [unclassified Helicobacter]MDO7253566.1 glycosyltransferase family 10 [Helicobacter sp. faydin-H75]MDP2539494.1 glycosyltransferase family 10 [Helicobacter sp. faydin-H76]